MYIIHPHVNREILIFTFQFDENINHVNLKNMYVFEKKNTQYIHISGKIQNIFISYIS